MYDMKIDPKTQKDVKSRISIVKAFPTKGEFVTHCKLYKEYVIFVEARTQVKVRLQFSL